MHIHQKSTQFSNGIKVLLFILITYTSWCNALSDDEVREAVRIVEQESMTPLRYCGRKLTQMMKMVCRKEVKGLLTSQFPLEKKSMDNKEFDFQPFYTDRIDNYEEDDIAKTRYKTEFDDLLPFNELASLQAKNRKRRGIIDECCRNPCSWVSLIKYCPNNG